MIKIEMNKGVGSVELIGFEKVVTCELATLFDELSEHYNDIFLNALLLYDMTREKA